MRGATTWTGEGQLAYQIFQSTLPVRGATMTIPPSPWLPTAFQSTLPVRGATAMVAAGIFHRAISIHAPRAGSDGLIERRINRYKYFNPRSPCGERQYQMHKRYATLLFQSTLPVRGATQYHNNFPHHEQFQSTLPVRGATFKPHYGGRFVQQFQSTLPVRGATCSWRLSLQRAGDFNPRSPCGERRWNFIKQEV